MTKNVMSSSQSVRPTDCVQWTKKESRHWVEMVEARRAEIAQLNAEIERLLEVNKELSNSVSDISFYVDDDPYTSTVKQERIRTAYDTISSNNAKCNRLLDEIAHLKKSRNKVGNGVYQGAFAFTLTKSPKDPYTVGDMLTAVRKVMHQKSCPVVKYAWYYEDKGRDANGDPMHPHIHGMYETASGGRIETRHWKRAWAIWNPDKPLGKGFQGGYHRPVRSDEGYQVYIKKDGGMGESQGLELTE